MAMADGTRWISNERSREVVQQLRGRVDAIIVGSGTVRADDPLLTARPQESGRREAHRALRIVVDSKATLPLDSQLVKTAREVPVLLAVGYDAPVEHVKRLADAGVEISICDGDDRTPSDCDSLLEELGRRRMTNVLVEGGSRLLHNALRHLRDRRSPRLHRAERRRRRRAAAPRD